jgi:serine/threonine-protein kinase
MELWEGRVLGGRYELGPRIGKGANGSVYEAKRVDAKDGPFDGHRCAVKVLGRHRDGEPRSRMSDARSKREIEIVAKLDHPHIAAAFDGGMDEDGTLWFAMRLVAGADLWRHVKGIGLDPKRAFEIIAQAAEALNAAHSANVIHRDVKPQNLLIDKPESLHRDSPDSRPFIYVADFGIATILFGDGGASGITTDGTITDPVRSPPLTPEYAAREQWLPGGRPTEKTDVCALGRTLFALLTGNAPTKGEPLELRRLPRSLRGRRRRATSELLKRMTHDVPARRPEMSAVAREVRPLARERGHRRKQLPDRRRRQRRGRRLLVARRWWSLLAVVALVAVIVAVAIVLLTKGSPTRLPSSPTPAPFYFPDNAPLSR